jgi:hypothetical protein
MTEEEIKSIYLSAEKAVAMLESPAGAEIRVLSPEIYTIAIETLNEYRSDYYSIKMKENDNARLMTKSIEEAVDLLKILPETSQSSIVALNNLITENSKKLQSELLFDSDTYYERYFFNLPAKMTEGLVKDITKNERFLEWFSGSKVVDDKNQPLLVYHGSSGNIDEFTEFKFDIFPGAYFAENKSYSEWFAKLKGGNEFMFRCYLRVLNPIDLTPFEVRKVKYQDFITYIKLRYGYDLPENKMLKRIAEAQDGIWAWQYLRIGVDWLRMFAKSGEFDGFHYYENNPSDIVEGKENVTPAWLVLYPNQIKTADMRNTTYSLFSNDIRMKQGGLL